MMHPKSGEDITWQDYSYNFTDHPSALYRGYTVAVAVVHLICVFIGVPAVFWALRVLFQHTRCDDIRVSIYTVFLLLTDVVELCLIPIIVVAILIKDSMSSDSKDMIVFAIDATRLCGLCFHQLVALESILSSRLSPPFHSIPICLTICLCTFFNLIYPLLLLLVAFVLFAGVVAVAVYTSFKALSSHADPATNHTASETKHVLAVAMGTLLLLYTPTFLLICIAHRNPVVDQVRVAIFCIMSLRLITEPWLCLLACRITHIKFKTDL